MRFVVVLAWLIGCGRTSSPSEPAVARETTASSIHEIYARADRLSADARSLDYRAPFLDVRNDLLERASELYVRACKAGIPRACWRALATTKRRSADAEYVAERMIAHCLANDEASCRVLSDIDQRRPVLFGYHALAHRRLTLSKSRLRQACDEGIGTACAEYARIAASAANERGEPEPEIVHAYVIKACDANHVMACDNLRDRMARHGNASSEEAKRLNDQVQDLALRECGRGNIPACNLGPTGKLRDETRMIAYQHTWKLCRDGSPWSCFQLYYSANILRHELGTFAAWELCQTAGVGCDLLHFRAKADGLPDGYYERSQLVVEHQCQLAHINCEQLAYGYAAQSYPEPVPGRARGLFDMFCAKKHENATDMDFCVNAAEALEGGTQE